MITYSNPSASPVNSHPLVPRFDVLNRQRFSGRLDVQMQGGSRPWNIYFYLGRIIYATGGTNVLRRWRRQLAQHCPGVDPRALNALIPGLAGRGEAWEYRLMVSLLANGKITRLQAVALTRSAVAEVMLDIAQVDKLTYRLHAASTLDVQLMVLTTEAVLLEMEQSWKLWQATGVTEYSLNKAPFIRSPERLKTRVTAPVYQVLANWLDGKRTLRDLAVQMKQNVFSLTRSLAPYIREGIIELAEVLDAPPAVPASPVVSAPPVASAKTAPLIACVDDSLQVTELMETIITGAGYRFLGLQDPLRALILLLQHKPDLVFLDLVMPNTNGYEICSRLRKTPAFQHIPIVILTGNDGIIDRVRAKVVGASDFLSKPVVAEIVLGMARKHLAARAGARPVSV